MRNIAWLFIVVGTWCLPATIRAADSTPADEHAALERALQLAGPQLYRHLPIVLIAALPGMVSPGASLDGVRRTWHRATVSSCTPVAARFDARAPALGSGPVSVEAGIDHRARSVASATRSGRGRAPMRRSWHSSG